MRVDIFKMAKKFPEKIARQKDSGCPTTSGSPDIPPFAWDADSGEDAEPPD
jgi:hypothetical protein